MCGRTAVTLDRYEVCRACCYNTSTGERRIPIWKQPPNGQSYTTSYNLGPTRFSPVLISEKQFNPSGDVENRIIQPMSWGLRLPAAASSSPLVINGRSESILEKPTFNTPLRNGRRCVVLADGYFEWLRDAKAKQPYFVYFPQPGNIKFSDPWRDQIGGDLWDEEAKCWKGPCLLTIAGVFNIDKSGDYSYAVMTVESSQTVSHLHDRMPAILEGDDEIRDWLDYGNIKVTQLVSLLKPKTNVQFYPVSSMVNNVRHDSPECIQPFSKQPPKVSASSKLLMQWLKTAPQVPIKKTVEDDQQLPAKRIKHE